MYYHRDIEKSMLEKSKDFQALAVYGSRQIGKSTTIRETFGDKFSYVTLDDADNAELALNNPKQFLQFYKWPLIIDEVQRAPNLLSQIKIEIDNQRLMWLKTNSRRDLMYILTGSNQFELQEKITESLAGRVAIMNMSSMTLRETENKNGTLFNPDIEEISKKDFSSLCKYKTPAEIFEKIFLGGMPDIIVNKVDRDVFFKSYVETYIEKDVKSLINVSSEMLFRKFVTYLAFRTSQQVNYEFFSREVGINSETCRRWLNILVSSGIIFLLEPCMANISKRIIKSPKLYFMDTGLCAYLCRWPDAKMLCDCAMNGAFFENYVVSEIIKSFYNNCADIKSSLFYYRDIDQKEIDLLYIRQNNIYPIEIKKGIAPSKSTKNFNVLSKYNLNIKTGLVIDNCEKIFPINQNAYYFPVSYLGA